MPTCETPRELSQEERDGDGWTVAEWSGDTFWRNGLSVYPTAISGPIEPPDEEKR